MTVTTRTTADEIDARTIADAIEKVMRLHYSKSFYHGLKPAQWHALRYFAGAEPSARTVTAFARHRASTMGTASTTISTLVRKGYLARTGAQSVPRNRGLHLTDAGWGALKQDPMNRMVASLEGLSTDQRRNLHDTLGKLMADLGAESPGQDEAAPASTSQASVEAH